MSAGKPMDRTMDDVKDRVAAIRWFHAIDLGNGITTLSPAAVLEYRDKADLVFRHPVAGKTVLDVGAWDGLFSFEAERRGAARVLATDHFCWSGEGWGTKAGFDLAHELLGSRVESRDIDVPDIAPETVGIWDVVLCMGVLYHVTDPLGLLRRIHAVTRELAVIETALDLEDLDRPALSFVNRFSRAGGGQPELKPVDPRAPLGEDGTNFFGPNRHAVLAMLDYIGFSRVEVHKIDAPIPRAFFYAFKSAR